ncbi:MAG: response regulator [Lachnospiraceae bacterium]|nr:response regulator [Lachnospiraceae bacterium]
MMEFLRHFQLSVELFLAGGSGVLILLTFFTETMSKGRKRAMILLELAGMLLLIFDRLAYLYHGAPGEEGYWLVRICNFFTFFFTLTVVHAFNLYLMDLYRTPDKLGRIPKALLANEVMYFCGFTMLTISQFTGWYYTFNAQNEYQRGPLFLLCYLFPVLMTVSEIVVMLIYRDCLTRQEFIPAFLFGSIPLLASILQIFLYGLSLTNIALQGMVVLLYFFEIKNLNALDEKRRKAEEANTAKSRFLINISHELRTPINTIMGMDEMILRADASEVPQDYHQEVTRYAKDIAVASDTLLSLVNDILDISQIESGNMYLGEKEYNLKELLQELSSLTRAKCQDKDLGFGIHVDGKLPEVLFGDSDKIHRIVQTFLNNSIKYTEEGQIDFYVTMEQRKQDEVTIKFAVEDTGVGLKQETINQMFAAFEDLDHAHTSNLAGTGLGLDIAKHFSDMMGGKIGCTSNYGRGSVFSFVVTQRAVDSVEIGDFTEQESEISTGAYVPRFIAPDISILAVDDNAMNLAVIQGLLAATKMYVVTSESGEDCLEKMEEGHYDLVLLDHMMPGMDGLETVAKIREHGWKVPVIALTANYISNGDDYYTSRGFDGYLPKPVDGETLEKVIRQFLPDEVVMDADEAELSPEAALGEEYGWLYDVDGISVEDGMRYSGGASGFVTSIQLFYDTIKEHAAVIQKAYDEGDLKFFTVKVHALKSSARIIGAAELSEQAKLLEDAGKKGDLEYIGAHAKEMLDLYLSYEEKLHQLVKEESDEGKELIPSTELEDAYGALKELAAQMDYDAIEMVLGTVKEYRLPKEDAALFRELEKAWKTFDWDRMEEILQEK